MRTQLLNRISIQNRRNDIRVIRKVYLQALNDFLTKNYIWVIAGLISFIIILEGIEHFSPYESNIFIFYAEVFFNILLLILTGYLTSKLLIVISERSRAVHILQMKHDLGMRLSSSHDLAGVASELVKQTVLILPLMGIELYLYEKNKNRFMPAADLNLSDLREKDSAPVGIDINPCRKCLERRGGRLHPFGQCNQKVCYSPSQRKMGYCLSLIQGNEPVGLLFLYTASQKDLSSEQKDLLEHLSSEMSSSLEIAIERKERDDQRLAQSIRTFQVDIARDLHDTIGQNISYLRMKLENLSERSPFLHVDRNNEIKSMVEVANESYDLIRGTLSVLQSTNPTDLFHLFSRYAEQVTERSMVNIEFSSQGNPKPLAPNLMRQLFYIFREALSNIEKHANASQVRVSLDWDEDSLDLLIKDDGRGFDPDQVPPGSHYGLTFMQDRAKQLRGSFSILSEINMGTEITVHVPCV